jgi:hypothetical protein
VTAIHTVRRSLLAAAVPTTKLIGKVHAPWAHKKVGGLHYNAALALLEPGDVLMSRTDGELTNLFIPGFWSHGAVYVGDGWVVEAIGEGVVYTDLVTWMTTKDAVRVCRPLFASYAQREAAALWARSFVGRRYDYSFASGNDAFYCFELTYAIYQKAMGDESPWTLRKTWGVDTVVGDDFDAATDKWGFPFDSRGWQPIRVAGKPHLVPVEYLKAA